MGGSEDIYYEEWGLGYSVIGVVGFLNYCSDYFIIDMKKLSENSYIGESFDRSSTMKNRIEHLIAIGLKAEMNFLMSFYYF